jgi:carboxyl-terminal processing protease
MMRIKSKIVIVFLSTVITLYAIIGGFLSKSGEAVARDNNYAQLAIFNEVLGHIIRDYVDEPDLEKVRIGSLRGLAEGLDPYSAYLTAEQVKQYNPQPPAGETGMTLSKVSGFAYVVGVLKGSPAEQAGVREGDFIEYVGKVPSRDLSVYDIEQLLDGQPGTAVSIRIVHQGQSRKVAINRAKLAQPAIEERMEEPGIGYIKVTSLSEGKTSEVRKDVNDLISKGAQKIVLDLRNASTGKLQEGVGVANLFVGQGKLAEIIGKEGKETEAFTADPTKVIFSGPLTVVMDRSTSGPAEVIAAAVKDQKRGEVVGERSFGAGSDQKLFALSDGGALLITIDKFAPASGKPFMEEPVTPTVKVDRPVEAEVIVPDSDDDDDRPEDKPEQPAAPPKQEPAAAPPVEDVQLKKAIEILKQTPAPKGQEQKHTAHAPKQSQGASAYEERYDG